MRYPATCACGEVRWLRKGDALKAATCARCQRVEAGKKGYAATVKAHGADFALGKLQAYRLSHPSSAEALLAEMLEELQPASFAREWRFDGSASKYLLDFMLLHPVTQTPLGVIEVQGWQHFNRPDKQARDERLRKELPWPLLEVPADNIQIDTVAQFVQTVYAAL
jgi:very-short-patch-repair endonuclease